MSKMTKKILFGTKEINKIKRMLIKQSLKELKNKTHCMGDIGNEE